MPFEDPEFPLVPPLAAPVEVSLASPPPPAPPAGSRADVPAAWPGPWAVFSRARSPVPEEEIVPLPLSEPESATPVSPLDPSFLSFWLFDLAIPTREGCSRKISPTLAVTGRGSAAWLAAGALD